MSELVAEVDTPVDPTKIRVMCFVDGFNLYHSLDWFEGGVSRNDRLRYKKYRWLSLRQLAQRYVRPRSEELVGVRYFTTHAHWDDGKVFRHKLYIRAQEAEGTEVTLGKFKYKQLNCQATCQEKFASWEEKQTDVNIARAIMEAALNDEFDRLILISGDSDQIGTLEFVHENFPLKRTTVVVPIGRSADELKQLAHTTEKMSEIHLQGAQMPVKVKVLTGEIVQKPGTW